MTLFKYILRLFIPAFFLSLLFFVFIVELADVFSNIFKYVETQVPWPVIFKIQYLYLPKAMVLSMPIACVFTASFILGTLQVRFELLGFFASGINLPKVVLPLLIFSAFASFSSFTINEQYGVPWLREKDSIVDKAIGRSGPTSNTEAVVYEKNKNRIWRAGFFDGEQNTINLLKVVQRDPSGQMVSLIEANQAIWIKDHWKLMLVTKTILDDPSGIKIQNSTELDDPLINLSPKSFIGKDQPVDSLDLSQAWLLIERRKSTGMNFREELTRYYERYSFAFTPLVVTLLALSAGRSFRKHVLLMSLLVSLGLAVLYYVIQMIAVLFATLGVLPPIVGAWTGCFLFLIIGTGLLWATQRV